MELKAIPHVLTLGLAWGLNVVVIRFGISQFDPYIFVGLRLIISTIFFLLMYAVLPDRNWSRDPKVWRNGFIVGFFGTAVPFVSFATALQYQSAGVTSLFVTTAPAITVTLAHFVLPEARLRWATVIGVIVALSGAVLIIALGETGLPNVTEANPLGYIFVMIALLSDSGTVVFIRKYLQGYDTVDVTSIRLLTGTVIVAPLAFLLRPHDFSTVNVNGWGALLFAGLIATVFAQGLFFYITRTFGTTTIAMVSYIVPIVAILTGVFFLGETITWGMVAGMVLIVSGIFIVNVRRQRKPVPIPARP